MTHAPALPAWMQHIEDTLAPFQKSARQFIASRPYSAIWIGMAGGKGITTLSALSYVREPGHILVVAPRNIAVNTWPEEVQKWNVPLGVTSFNVTPAERTTATGRPAKMRNLKPAEFQATMDAVSSTEPRLYTVSVDQFDKLVEYCAVVADPSPRGPFEQAPDGVVDVGTVRASMPSVLKSFKELAAEAVSAGLLGAAQAEQAAKLLSKAMVLSYRDDLSAPAVLLGHDVSGAVSAMRAEPVSGLLSRAFADVVGAPLTVVNRRAQRDYARWPFPTVVIDESQTFKTHSSIRFKGMVRVRPYIRRMVQLSGTPAPEETGELWAQVALLDGGQALGQSMTDFRNAFFAADKMIDGRVVKWKISEANRKEVYRRIAHLALSAENTTLELPGFEPTTTHLLQMGPELVEAYERFREESVLSVLLAEESALKARAWADEISFSGDECAADEAFEQTSLQPHHVHTVAGENAAVLRGRLLQFASGSIYLDIGPDDPGYDKATEVSSRPVLSVHSLKADRIVEIMDRHRASGRGGGVLIAYRFNSEKDIILHRLREAGHEAVAFDGMPATKDAWNRREIPVMLLHPASAGHGLNLQFGGSVIIWATLPDSNEHFRQTPARLNRVGQERPVAMHVLLTEGTVDEQMPGALSRKESTQQELLSAMRRDIGAVAAASGLI